MTVTSTARGKHAARCSASRRCAAAARVKRISTPSIRRSWTISATSFPCAEELQGRVQALGQALPAEFHPDLAGDRRQARRGVSACRGGCPYPGLTVNIEVRETAAYIHGPAVPGAGGLPTGTGGRAAVLLSGGIDSPVAGYMIAKRGVELECIHFFSYPYTSERAKDKVLELARLMTR